MRYTTCIDISEFPHLYRSASVRLVYLHLCLRAGYHDNDRDLCDISLRRLADQVGISIGAARHAVSQLLRADLLVREGDLLRVRKFIMEQPISKRARSEKEKKRQEAKEIEAQDKALRDQARARHEAEMAAIYDSGKTPFMVYYESQWEKAVAGDLNAQAYCRQHRATYESHKNSR